MAVVVILLLVDLTIILLVLFRLIIKCSSRLGDSKELPLATKRRRDMRRSLLAVNPHPTTQIVTSILHIHTHRCRGAVISLRSITGGRL